MTVQQANHDRSHRIASLNPPEEKKTIMSSPTSVAEPGRVSDVQAAILDFIAEHIDLFGWAPSVREIGGHVGLRSTSTVHHHLRRLEELGLIVRGSRQSRATSVGKAAA